MLSGPASTFADASAAGQEAAMHARRMACSQEHSRWYVAQAYPAKEAWAIDHMQRQGFATFFPRFQKQQKRLGQDRRVLAPVFPGYIFVSFDIADRGWTAINSTRGVKRLVGPVAARPQPVPIHVMATLRQRCRNEIMAELIDSPGAGDQVKIIDGPFSNSIATIESMAAPDRVNVLLQIMGAPQTISMALGSIAPVGA